LNLNHELRVLEPEIQERRYQHKEERKKHKINNAIERRKEIIENPDKLFSNVNKNNTTLSY
jgi:hypothetical protein